MDVHTRPQTPYHPHQSTPNMQVVSMSIAGCALLLSTVGLTAAGYAASDALQHNEHEEHKHDAKPYNFGYGVVSHKHGVDFGQQENSDGHKVTGHYRVKLPDGRTQVVTYTADWTKGYNAHVAYEGHAAHPQVYQHQQQEAPAEEHSSGAGLSEGSLGGGYEGGASLGGGYEGGYAGGYAGAESYASQESIGQPEHSSGY